MSAGSIIIDLLLKTGSFETDTDRAAKHAKKKAKEIDDAFKGIGNAIAGGIAGFGVGAAIAKVIDESREAQQEQAQLAAVLKSTGEAAGFNADQLNAMAERMSGLSIFSDGDINKAQARLLSYTNIVGQKFPEALQAAIDMATRLGMPIEQAAEQIGKALDVPSQGLSALSKQGFRFTEDQKKLVESLENTGKVAEAQKIVLDALNSSYGGAAEAARNTFGGALSGLKNQLDSLMTGDDGSLEGATESVNDLTKVLGSKETKAAFDSFTGLVAGTINLLAKATTEFLNFSRFIGEFAGQIANGTADPIERADERIGELKQSIEQLNKEINRPLTAGLRQQDVDQMKAMRAEAEKELKALQGMRDTLTRNANMAAPKTPEAAMPTGRTPAGGGGKTPKGKDPDADFRAYLNNLQQQIQKTNELTTVEKLLDDIRRGALSVTDKQKETLLGLAQIVDKEKELLELRRISRDAAIAQGDAVNRENDERLKRLTQLLDAGDGAQLEKTRDDMKLLADEYERFLRTGGQYGISESQYLDAVNARLGLLTKGTGEAKSMAEQLGMTFTSAFEDAIVNGGNLSDVFKGLLQDVLRLILRMQVLEPMMKSLKDGASAGGGGGIGSVVSGISDSISDFFSGMFRADGGPVEAGKPYIVGERRPELFVPNTAGRILPQVPALGGGRGEAPVIVNQTQGRIDNVRREEVDGREVYYLQQVDERIAQALGDPQSRTSRALGRNFAVRRNR